MIQKLKNCYHKNKIEKNVRLVEREIVEQTNVLQAKLYKEFKDIKKSYY